VNVFIFGLLFLILIYSNYVSTCIISQYPGLLKGHIRPWYPGLLKGCVTPWYPGLWKGHRTGMTYSKLLSEILEDFQFFTIKKMHN